MRRIAATLAIALIAGIVLGSGSALTQGLERPKEFVLFDGATFSDTLEHASPWIPVRGANRIIIQTWSGGTGAWTGADSAFSDSIGIFNVLFSDSVLFLARDSSGTIVTVASATVSLRTATPGEPQPFPMCVDSVVIAGNRSGGVCDTTYKQVCVQVAPIQIPLRPAANGGGGIYTNVVPALGNGATWGDGAISPNYMRIRFTPITRNTLSGSASTSPNRTAGIRALRMRALVYYKNL